MGSEQRLTIIGDIGVDFVLGTLSEWPRPGTETLMDRSELRAGGSAANAALAVSYLGGASRLISAVGDDDLGAWLTHQLRGLDPSLAICQAATTVTVGLIHAHGERTFFTTRGHLDQLSYDVLGPRLTAAPDSRSIALLSGIFLTPALRPAYPRLIRELQGLGYQVALDTNWPPHDWDRLVREEVAGWIGLCDHVLLNEIEVASLADSANLTQAIDRVTRMLKRGATLVVKLGARGAVAVRDGRKVEHPAPQAAIFDTIGAGDSFNAAYLLAQQQGMELVPSLGAGCRGASAIIARFPRRSIQPGELARSVELSNRRAEGA